MRTYFDININNRGEKMKKIISLLSALIISVVSFAGISNAADSKKPIVIPTHLSLIHI